MEPELIADYRCVTGEGPAWHPLEKRLYWVDIPKGRMFRYDPATGSHEQLYEGAVIGGFTIQSDGALLLFMAGVGRNTSFERRLDYGITESAWGRVPGVSSLKTNPEDPTLTPGAVFVGAAIVLLAIGFLL